MFVVQSKLAKAERNRPIHNRLSTKLSSEESKKKKTSQACALFEDAYVFPGEIQLEEDTTSDKSQNYFIYIYLYIRHSEYS